MSHLVPLFSGDGIGPEISSSVKKIFKAAAVPVEWTEISLGQSALDNGEAMLPASAIEKIQQHHFALKGPLNTPAGKGVKDLNHILCEHFHLYARVTSFASIEGIPSRYSNVNFVLISGIEDHSGKVSVQDQSDRLIRYAFEYARKHQRRKITLVHEEQSGKEQSVSLLRSALSVSRQYPEILLQDLVLEKASMELVDRPERFDLLVSTDRSGGILTHLGMALTGGIALTACSNVGKEITIFEPVHGTAGDITGMGIANPVAMIRAGLLVLDYLGLKDHVLRIEQAMNKVLADSASRTVDVKGSADTEKFTNRILEQLQ